MKKMFALYKYENGKKFTGIVASTKRRLLQYLNDTHIITVEYPDGTTEKVSRWNPAAYSIEEVAAL